MTEVTFTKRLDGPPKADTQIYALAAPGATPKALLQLAKGFGIESTRAVQAQDRVKLTYTAGQHVLTLFRASGAVRYQDQTRWQIDDGKSNLELSDADASKLALEHVTKRGLASPKELTLLKVSRLTVGDGNVDAKSGNERIVDVGVAFQRTIEGVPVDGPGGKLIVYLDQQSELTGFDRIWRATKGVQAKVPELRSPKEAEADMLRYWGRQNPARIEVYDMRFGYFERGFDESQRVLQPAYVMLLSLMSTNERFSMKTVHVFPAATNAVGTIMPPAKKPIPQPPRQ
jgi:hypothetical protein